jgi:O-acetyl-ADP-ribose deacetylase (regulator of RNase III)
MAIIYLKGDATNPQTSGNKIIAHICNDIGAWGRGFVLSVSKRWPHAEADYRNWHQQNPPIKSPFDLPLDSSVPPYPKFKLGSVRCVHVAPNIYVANMIAQHGIMMKDGIQPIRYDALEQCLHLIAGAGGDSIHMPRIGCGLAGGEWSKIEPIILKTLKDLDVYVYDYDTLGAQHIPWKS